MIWTHVAAAILAALIAFTGGLKGSVAKMVMGGPMMGWGHMRGYYSSLTPEQLKQRQYMMDQYMGMQQMMMDHMMQRQQWMTPSPASAGK